MTRHFGVVSMKNQFFHTIFIQMEKCPDYFFEGGLHKTLLFSNKVWQSKRPIGRKMGRVVFVKAPLCRPYYKCAKV